MCLFQCEIVNIFIIIYAIEVTVLSEYVKILSIRFFHSRFTLKFFFRTIIQSNILSLIMIRNVTNNVQKLFKTQLNE